MLKENIVKEEEGKIILLEEEGEPDHTGTPSRHTMGKCGPA